MPTPTKRSLSACLLVAVVINMANAQKPPMKAKSPVKDIRLECNSENIIVSIFTNAEFNGMVYPKGLSKNSSCMAEFIRQASPVQYTLSLRSCNTMGIEQEEGIEYFNTIVVQPHRKLVTNQGRGFHVRCQYQTRDKASNRSHTVDDVGSASVTAVPPMPVCSMRIYSNPTDKTFAETVHIGDPLTLEVSIEQQPVYGLKVLDCMVRDGLGWGQQPLIDGEGCPVDYEILGPFSYSDTKTRATVQFQAHKFPYTASVYYQCNVRLCLKSSAGCQHVPPTCERGGGGKAAAARRRRELQNATVTDFDSADDERLIEVFSGLYVNEGADTDLPADNAPTRSELDEDDILCISPRTFAIVIAIVGLLLMIAVIVAIMVIISRRRRRQKQVSTTGSSIYSGPYTNTAYSHSS